VGGFNLRSPFGANDALPWIIFARDRLKFEQEFPDWRIETIKPIMPFRYLFPEAFHCAAFAPVGASGYSAT
jgi:hypothetical protein